MSTKLMIVLFVTIFCSGLAYSAPPKDIPADNVPKEKTVPTVAEPSHINQKIEPNTTVPEIKANHTESLPSKNITIPANVTQTDSKVTFNNATVIDNKVANQTIANKTNSTETKTPVPPPSVTTVNNTEAVTTNKTVTDITPEAVTEMARPVPAGQTTTSSTTTSAATKAPATQSTTVTPTTTVSTTTQPCALQEHKTSQKAQERGFDGASFVGGIVLTVGLTAIGFIAFKYYKSGKIDGNYRTL